MALGLWSTGSIAHGLSCSVACGVFPARGLKLGLLHWQADSFTTEPPEKCPFLNLPLALRERKAFIPSGTSKEVDVTLELPTVGLVPGGDSLPEDRASLETEQGQVPATSLGSLQTAVEEATLDLS